MAGRRMTRRTGLIVAAAVIAAAVGLYWALDLTTRGDAGAPDASASPYTISIVRAGTTLGTLTLGDLRELPQETFEQFGKTEEGPALADVLASVGVDEYSAVEVRGMGLRDDGRQRYEGAALDGALLDIAKRGTVKSCGPAIDWRDRVRDVTTIVIL